ncbi:MAG: hypothetical protein K6U02_09190 [Firmicutes bacterium]|nr:hypothetical protein [Bacillota bacterium]
MQFLSAMEGPQQFVTLAALVTGAAQLIFLFNFLWSLKWGRKAEALNPWRSTSLEWTIPSPPPHDNFGGRQPVVYHGPYEYSVPGEPEDFIPQDAPPRRVTAPGV